MSGWETPRSRCRPGLEKERRNVTVAEEYRTTPPIRWIVVLEKTTKMAFNASDKARDFQTFKHQHQCLNVRKRDKIAQVTATECLRHQPRATVLHHPYFPYEGHRAKLMQLGQRLQLVRVCESKGVVKMWDHGHVPGAACQWEGLESVEIAGDMGDDHFHNFIWKVAGRYVCGTCLWRRITEQAIDVDLALVPNGLHTGREVHLCGASGAEVRAVYAHRLVVIPGAVDVGLLGRLTCPDVGGFVETDVSSERCHRRSEVIRLDQPVPNPQTATFSASLSPLDVVVPQVLW